ncbi:hypothetical protein EXN61_15665 [Agrobacterium tumefaciens]|uniref:Propionyl-coenzyme A carboxylase alpha polypeptide n=1 Tax=Agrobacterium tumefaciens TaxID=358 RepID=A0A546XXU4_AGRTU|nr:hypothetical protein EXN61_15665 [Agrobacterium tumefaciens]
MSGSVLAAHPPLSCRTSPPQGGRSTRGYVLSSREVEDGARDSVLPISPLEGEMPGRAEGGKPHTPHLNAKAPE